MVNDDLDQIEQTRNIPRSKDNAFNIRQLSIREFEAFMILLIHEGEVQSTLKQLIDIEFDQKSPVKTKTKLGLFVTQRRVTITLII